MKFGRNHRTIFACPARPHPRRSGCGPEGPDTPKGEAPTVLLLTANVFLLLTAYYLLKVAREPLILLGAGAEVKSYASVAQAILLIFGPKRLPALGRSLGQGMREFKDSVTGHSPSEPAQLPPPETTTVAAKTREQDTV